MFIEVDDGLPEHPKSNKLCAALRNPLAWAYAIKLWRWCCKYAKDGDLSKFGDDEIEYGIGWNGEAGALIGAMRTAGFIERTSDGRSIVHDWMKGQGKALAKMDADAERKRNKRLSIGHPSDAPQDIQGSGDRTAPVPNLTNQTNQTEDACPAPVRVDAREWRKGLSDRWREKSGAKGFSFPMLDDLADECDAAAKQLSMQPLDVFDRVVAEFLKYRTECSTGRAPNLVPAKVVQHFATLVERMTGAAPKGPAPDIARRNGPLLAAAEPAENVPSGRVARRAE